MAMEGDLAHAVGRNLRDLRQASGLSQEDLADYLDLHRTYLGGVERGERNLTLRSVERLAARLNTTPRRLLFGITDDEAWPVINHPKRH